MTMLLALLGSLAFGQDTAEIERLLSQTDDIQRGQSSIATMEMQVKTSRYERSMKMKAWSKGTEKSLIQILDPAKEAGTATLKVDDNLWNYLPKVDRTMKVPAGMMSGSWMGSHVSNDDLVKDSRLSEDYDFTVREKPEGDQGQWVIALTPHPDTPVVWGEVVVTLRADEMPVKMEFFDEKGNLARVMAYSDYVELDGRKLPRVMRFEPQDKPGEFTEVRYVDIDFDVEIPDSRFTLQALKAR